MNAYWPTAESDPAATGPTIEFARIWDAKPKVVVSSSMQEAPAGWRLTGGDPETILEELRREFSGTSRSAGRRSPPASSGAASWTSTRSSSIR